MSKFDSILKAVKIGGGIGKVFLPGAAGSVLSVVTDAIDQHSDKPSEASKDALTALARDNDEQTAALLALHERVKALEAKIGR